MSAIRLRLERLIGLLGYQVIRHTDSKVPLSGYTEGLVNIPQMEFIKDSELEILNDLLPWASFVVDQNGRRFGKPFSGNKRNHPEVIPDPRILELNKLVPLHGLTVLEVGCFEGNHTCTLCELAARVIAVDARIEHVVKTLVRCAMFNQKPDIYCIDLEQEIPSGLDLNCDVLHHIGVLYHLTDPVSHLKSMAKITKKAILLDTHVAPEKVQLHNYTVDGDEYPFYRFTESGRSGPFAGTMDHAKWLRQDDLIQLIKRAGFHDVEIIEQRKERNGPRIQLLAKKAEQEPWAINTSQ